MYTVDQRRQNLVIPSNTLSTMEKVLGIVWDPMLDELQYKVQLKTVIKNKRKKPDQQDMKMLDIVNNPSKRTILAQVNSIYDPLRLAGPFTVRAKILMRQIWGAADKLDWDDPILDKYKQGSSQFCQDLLGMNDVKFKRCLKIIY